jgi:hypothetical protein
MKFLPALAATFFALPVAAQQLAITGAVAYTDVLRYDYTGDGKRNRVQFWLEFEGRTALGAPGQPGYAPAAGTIRYFLKDVDDGTKVLKWRQGLDMAGAPRDAPLPMTNLSIEGNTARFEAFGMKWTVVDGGDGYASDRIVVDDGYKTLDTKKLYGGDVRVGPMK